MRTLRNAVLILLLICSVVGTAVAQLDIKPATYTWVAGGMGGGWYTVAGGLSRLINEKEPRITIKVIPGGGVSNPISLANGDAEIAWGVAWLDRAAYNGVAPLFKQAYTNMCSITGNMAADPYHFLAAKDQNISTFEEFAAKIKKGEKVKVAAPMTGTSELVLIGNVMDYYGISFDQIRKNGGTVIQAIYGDMTGLYKDRHVDYALTCVGLPAAIITEMSISRPSTLLSLSDACVDHFASTTGTVTRTSGLAKIPGGTYSGIPNDVQTLAQSTEILVSPKMPEAVAYAMTKIINENKAALVQLGGGYKIFDPKTTALAVQVPLHPGALKYYKEVGVVK